MKFISKTFSTSKQKQKIQKEITINIPKSGVRNKNKFHQELKEFTTRTNPSPTHHTSPEFKNHENNSSSSSSKSSKSPNSKSKKSPLRTVSAPTLPHFTPAKYEKKDTIDLADLTPEEDFDEEKFTLSPSVFGNASVNFFCLSGLKEAYKRFICYLSSCCVKQHLFRL